MFQRHNLPGYIFSRQAKQYEQVWLRGRAERCFMWFPKQLTELQSKVLLYYYNLPGAFGTHAVRKCHALVQQRVPGRDQWGEIYDSYNYMMHVLLEALSPAGAATNNGTSITVTRTGCHQLHRLKMSLKSETF